MVFLSQHIAQAPKAEPMNIAELAFAVEDLLRPFPGKVERTRELAEKFDDLSDVIVIFAVLGA